MVDYDRTATFGFGTIHGRQFSPTPTLGMSLYDLHNATLENIEGEGYCFSKKTVFGKQYQGVFFGDGVEKFEDEDEVTFSGIVYDRSREKEKTFNVEVTNVTPTPAGERADFVATEKP